MDSGLDSNPPVLARFHHCLLVAALFCSSQTINPWNLLCSSGWPWARMEVHPCLCAWLRVGQRLTYSLLSQPLSLPFALEGMQCPKLTCKPRNQVTLWEAGSCSSWENSKASWESMVAYRSVLISPCNRGLGCSQLGNAWKWSWLKSIISGSVFHI